MHSAPDVRGRAGIEQRAGLYREPEEVRNATHITLSIEHAVGEVAWKAGDGADITVMISTDHLSTSTTKTATSPARCAASSSTR